MTTHPFPVAHDEKQPTLRFERDHAERLIELMAAVARDRRQLARSRQALEDEMQKAAQQ